MLGWWGKIASLTNTNLVLFDCPKSDVANTHFIAPPYGSRVGGNEVGGSEVNVLIIEATSVIKSLASTWFGVLMVKLGNSVYYPGHLCSCLCGQKRNHFSPCSLSNCPNKDNMLLTWQ